MQISDETADRLARRRLGEALLVGLHEPPERSEARIDATLAAFDAAQLVNEEERRGSVTPATSPRKRPVWRWIAAATTTAALLLIGVGTLLSAPPDARAAVAQLAKTAAEDGPRRFDLTLTTAGGDERRGVLIAEGRRFRVDMEPRFRRGAGLAFGSDGEGSWIRGPAGTTRFFDRPGVWRTDPTTADARVLTGPPGELLAELAERYDLSFADRLENGVRPVRGDRRLGDGPDRALVTPDADGVRTERLRLEFDDDRDVRVRSVELLDAGPAESGLAEPPAD
ncbi:MAG: hypothetical protein AAF907_10620 [Planctomycetota bacterium]